MRSSWLEVTTARCSVELLAVFTRTIIRPAGTPVKRVLPKLEVTPRWRKAR